MTSFAPNNVIALCAAVLVTATLGCRSASPKSPSTTAATQPQSSDGEDRHSTPSNDRAGHRELGAIDFPVSCNQQAQADFEQALALLHHMMYEQARASFESIAQQDSTCAMAHWGVAMTLFHPLWGAPPTDEDLDRGTSAVARAGDIGQMSDRERAYIDIAAAYYEKAQERPEQERLEAFERATRQLHQSYPDDPDAAAFHALALLATAPTDDPTYANQRRAAAILKDIHQQLPRHPGAIHYGIHAHDFPPLATEGAFLADVYDSIAPEVPHALHMPSHIFVRLGHWRKTADWNRRSAAAAARHPVNGARSMHYAHARDYEMYAYLQRMQDRRAAAIIEDIDSTTSYQLSPPTAYAIAAIHVRLPVEQQDWQGAAELSTDAISAEIPWEQFPFATAVVLHARGLGLARSGSIEAAQKTLAELDAIVERLEAGSQEVSSLRYWHGRGQIQRDTVAAWIAQAQDRHGEARKLMSRAAERERDLGKHPTMPAFIVPARELEGDLLLEQDRPRLALASYQASLSEYPRRANSLFGAAQAARALGDVKMALDYAVRLVAMGSDADEERPILREARAYLGAHQESTTPPQDE